MAVSEQRGRPFSAADLLDVEPDPDDPTDEEIIEAHRRMKHGHFVEVTFAPDGELLTSDGRRVD